MEDDYRTPPLELTRVDEIWLTGPSGEEISLIRDDPLLGPELGGALSESMTVQWSAAGIFRIDD